MLSPIKFSIFRSRRILCALQYYDITDCSASPERLLTGSASLSVRIWTGMIHNMEFQIKMFFWNGRERAAFELREVRKVTL